MQQVIRPLPCAVDHIVDTDGQTYYFAPRECGQLIVPNENTTNAGGNSAATPGSGAQIVPKAQPIFLDDSAHTSSSDAYLLLARKGQAYIFRLVGDSDLSSPRTMQVLQITANSLTLLFSPGDKQVTLQSGSKIYADIAFGQAADVNIHVVKTSSDGVATVRVWFPLQEHMFGVTDDTKHSFVATSILVGLSGFAVYSHFHVRSRTKVVLLYRDHWYAM